jgi:glycosyltransferase involved in cell wall biosynthesis
MSKILIVGQWFVSEDGGNIVIPGGTERYVYGLTKQLQNDGYDVMVLTATTNKGETGFNVLDGLNVCTFKVTEKLYGYSVDILSFINTLKLIRRFDPDIVHVIATRYRFAAGAIAAAKIMKVRNVYTRTTLPHTENRRWLPVLLDDWVFTKLLRQSDISIALSRGMKDAMEREIHPKLIEIIPSFIMKSYYSKVEKDDNRVLFVGRLDRLKGIEYLIESLCYVRKEIPEVRLSIAGTGDLMQHLKQLVSRYGLEDNVTFEGHLGEDMLVDIYSRSGIFVFPSLREGMPMALLEAMSAGLPVVAFDIEPLLEAMSAGLPVVAFDIEPNVEALGGGKYGMLVKTGDVESLAREIIQLLKNEERRAHYSKVSMERSKEYSQETVVRRIEGVYLDLYGA